RRRWLAHALPLPKPPGTPVVTETTATSITIIWDSGNPEPVSHYIIQYRAKSPESKFETVESITTTRYSIGGLSSNTDYEIRVSAYNTIGQGPPSEPVEARTGEQAPASPPPKDSLAFGNVVKNNRLAIGNVCFQSLQD
uniref:Fibronectin type-III domain-containing protein n=1 Tax=Sinocyclocheilus grahami TaxID=75366 RepID=A0A672SLP4_SINGR